MAALPEAILRAYRMAMTEPQGPVYLCFDTELQEEAVEARPCCRTLRRFMPPRGPGASDSAVSEAASLLVNARWPVIIPDMFGRNRDAIPLLQELAELLGCGVVDSGSYFNFPSTHPLDLSLNPRGAISEADVVLALDVLDLHGAVSAGIGPSQSQVYLDPSARVIHITLGDFLQSKWTTDNERLVPVDVPISADSASALPQLITICRDAIAADTAASQRIQERTAANPADAR